MAVTNIFGRFFSRRFRINFAFIAALLLSVVFYHTGDSINFGFPIPWIYYYPAGHSEIFPRILDIRHSSLQFGILVINSFILYWCATIPTRIISKRTKKEMIG